MTIPIAGIHLPQAGRAASGASIAAAARHAEELGFGTVWVSDHLVMDATPGLSAHMLDPIVSLTWAAAATTRIGLGTSVLLLPLRHPVVLAKSLATLDELAGQRLTVGVGGGWLRAEFAALGVPFDRRGPLTAEAIDVLRALWSKDPLHGAYPEHGLHLDGVRAKPQPTRRLPLWVGGMSAPARARAVERGDGWHALSRGLTPSAEFAAQVAEVRERRSDPEFAVSLRVPWDGLQDDADDLARALESITELGVDHVVTEPRQRTVEDWCRSAERLAAVFEQVGLRAAVP